MKTLNTQRGFTLVELLVVVAIVGIIAAIALPNYLAMRESANFREAARSISSTLRDARSKAISHNSTYSVVFRMSDSTYQLQGAGAPSNWSQLQPGVTLSAPQACTDTSASGDRTITFSPNGTANLLYICVMDGSTPKFRVGVSSQTTGRVEIQ